MQTANPKNFTPAGRLQAGHTPFTASGRENGRTLLAAVRRERSESFRVFACVLSGVVKRRISKPYLIAMEKGTRPIPADVEAALWRLAALLDSADPDILNAHTVSVRTTRNVAAGSIITADSRACARPGCMESFIPSNPFQRYHSPYCREQARKERECVASQ